MSALLERTGPAEAEDELVRRARQLYDHQKLRVLLEPNPQGRYVAIEPDTGRYFLGDTGTAALVEAHTSMPKHSLISPELAMKLPILFTAMASTSGKIASAREPILTVRLARVGIVSSLITLEIK